MSTMWEVRGNKYWATTDWKTGRRGNQERAMDGYDLELGIPLPYMNWATVFANHFKWDAFNGVADKKGEKYSLRAMFPGVLTGLEVEAGRSYYSGSTYSDENFIQVSYNVTELFKNKKSRKSRWFSDKAYELGSVEDRRFEKVRRTNKIVKQIGSSGFSATVSGI
jgi:adhesin/invasin